MKQHFQTELRHLRNQVGDLGRMVVENVAKATEALLTNVDAPSEDVLHAEHQVDFAEVQLEEDCLKVIALHQPVADDLRMLVGMVRIDHDLERISDLAAALAKRSRRLPAATREPYAETLFALAELCREMTEESLQAFLERDVERARQVWRRDDDVDDLRDHLRERLRNDIQQGSGDQSALFELLETVADFERMGDHAANIAKTVMYQIIGRIVRHRGREFRRQESGGKTRVLFVCVHNSARSQMAAAWLNQLYGEHYEARSAGLTPGELNPLAVAAMREVGIDISQNQPRDVFETVQAGDDFDYVITVCDGANAERCPPVLGIAEQVQWEFEDPASFEGTEEEKLERTRRVRDLIRARLEQWVRIPAEPGGEDLRDP